MCTELKNRIIQQGAEKVSSRMRIVIPAKAGIQEPLESASERIPRSLLRGKRANDDKPNFAAFAPWRFKLFMVIDKMRETHECMAFPCRSLKIIRKFKCLERPPFGPLKESREEYARGEVRRGTVDDLIREVSHSCPVKRY